MFVKCFDLTKSARRSQALYWVRLFPRLKVLDGQQGRFFAGRFRGRAARGGPGRGRCRCWCWGDRAADRGVPAGAVALCRRYLLSRLLAADLASAYDAASCSRLGAAWAEKLGPLASRDGPSPRPPGQRVGFPLPTTHQPHWSCCFSNIPPWFSLGAFRPQIICYVAAFTLFKLQFS